MRKKSKRSRKSNRVSWASGDDLCQVKLFFSEDCPAILGLKSQDDLQDKASGSSCTDNTRPSEHPPGFECRSSANKSGVEPSYVCQIKWKCPSKFDLSCTWQVAAGEESEEAKHQKSRELRVLEAVYPRFSAIPSCPSVSSEIEKEVYDDSQTPLVSIIPIEEEESLDTQCDIPVPENTTISSQPPPQPLTLCKPSSLPLGNNLSEGNPMPAGKPTNPSPDVATAASAALAEAIRTSNDKGSMIDTDLLIKILSDKNMIQRLMVDGLSTNSGPPPIPEPRVVNAPRPMPVTTLGNPIATIQDGLKTTLNPATLPKFQQVGTLTVPLPIIEPSPSLPRLSNANSFGVPIQVRLKVSPVSVRPPTMTTVSTNFAVQDPVQPVKDMNYYKNLIRQHGEEKEEGKDSSIRAQNGKNYYPHHESNTVHNFKPGESKTKNTKPCMYFKSSRGCLKGTNCPFQHDVSVQWPAGNVMEGHSAKRMKFNGEINGGMLV